MTMLTRFCLGYAALLSLHASWNIYQLSLEAWSQKQWVASCLFLLLSLWSLMATGILLSLMLEVG